MSNELRDKLAYEWQNTKCFEGQLIIENARTRWAKIDYGAGWDAAIAHLSEKVEFYESSLNRLKEENEILKAKVKYVKDLLRDRMLGDDGIYWEKIYIALGLIRKDMESK